jgi:hypothetical protein
MRAAGKERIREQYAWRDVVYLLDADDTFDNGSMDTDCAAMLQGEHRYERGLVYVNHLAACYGLGVRGWHRVEVVPGVGHDGAAMYRSAEGQRALFAR